MKKTTFIYGLECPISGHIRYIGKSNNPKDRFYTHISECKKVKRKKTHKECWILSLINKKLKPNIFIIDEIDVLEWEFWEKHYISLFKSWGYDLTNFTDGGVGISLDVYNKNKNHLKKSRRRSLKGEKNPMYGKKFSKEHKRKISESKKGKKPWNYGIHYMTEKQKNKLRKPILCHQNNKKYKSIKDAALDLNLKKEAISAVVRGARTHHKGFTFEYIIKK